MKLSRGRAGRLSERRAGVPASEAAVPATEAAMPAQRAVERRTLPGHRAGHGQHIGGAAPEAHRRRPWPFRSGRTLCRRHAAGGHDGRGGYRRHSRRRCCRRRWGRGGCRATLALLCQVCQLVVPQALRHSRHRLRGRGRQCRQGRSCHRSGADVQRDGRHDDPSAGRSMLQSVGYAVDKHAQHTRRIGENLYRLK